MLSSLSNSLASVTRFIIWLRFQDEPVTVPDDVINLQNKSMITKTENTLMFCSLSLSLSPIVSCALRSISERLKHFRIIARVGVSLRRKTLWYRREAKFKTHCAPLSFHSSSSACTIHNTLNNSARCWCHLSSRSHFLCDRRPVGKPGRVFFSFLFPAQLHSSASGELFKGL